MIFLQITVLSVAVFSSSFSSSDVQDNPNSSHLKIPLNCQKHEYFVKSKNQTNNSVAKYINGNRQRERKGVKNLHLNIRSLTNKVTEVKNIIKEQRPHIFGLSECELRKSGRQYDESKLKIPGYDILFPKSWESHGFARVLVYVKKNLEFVQVEELDDDLAQSVWLRAGFKGQKKVFYCHLYREHTSTLGNSIAAQKKSLETLLAQWEAATLHGNPSEPNETHICGDMNLDCHEGKWLRQDYSLLSLSKLVQVACNLSNFTQLVTQPTRIQHNSIRNETSVSCIDHFYCNTKHRCSKVSIIPFGNSDHDLLCYTRYSKEPVSPSRTIRKRSYKNFEETKFLCDLSEVDWTPVYSCQEVDLAEATFTRIFSSVLDIHAPWVQYQHRKGFKPWITKETKLLIKERDQWKKVASELAQQEGGGHAGEDQVHAWEQYKRLRNRINNKKKSEEIRYKAEKVKENLDSPEKTWRITKQFMEWSSQGPPQQLLVGGKLVTSARIIAKLMNEYFLEKIKKIRQGMGNISTNYEACKRIMSGKSCSLSFRHVNVEKIKKLLKSLKNTKSTSVDGLDNFCVKLSSDIIAQPLHHIITLSILQSRFPTSWKSAKIIPLHKKDSALEKQNYRPVAILTPLGKILEKVVFEQLYSYFNRNKIFHPNLHGYRQNRSTQTTLLQMYDRWVRAAHHSKVTGVVLLDLSAAFDLVDHQLLLEKLGIYGVEPEVKKWISSYLRDRSQAVWMDHCYSPFMPVDVGVPQGSNLGPLFFLIFYNDLPATLTCEVDAYADDSTMSYSAGDGGTISQNLTENCSKISRWMRENRFKLNASKTHILTVGTSIRVNNLNSPIKVEMDNITLIEDSGRTESLLGIELEFSLKWHKSIQKVQSKLKKRLAGLARLRFLVSMNILKIISQGIFDSVLVYCLPLYGGCDKGDLNSLQVLQNKAAQIVTRSPPRSARDPMFDKLKWLTVNQLIAYHTALQVFRIRINDEPEYLAKILKKDNRNENIVVTNTELTLAKRSFTFRGAELWNCLPNSIRNQTNIGGFKKMLRIWVKENIPRFC